MAKKPANAAPFTLTFDFDPDARPIDWARCASQFYDMIVHTRSHRPGKLLELNRPGETEESKLYGLSNFRSITKGAINRVKSDILGAISSSKYTVWSDDPDIQDFIFNRRFGKTMTLTTGYDYTQYMIKLGGDRLFDDANGFMTWLPTGTPDKTQKLDVYPYQIYRVSVIHLDPERITFFMPEARFKLEDGTYGRKFWTITKTEYIQHTQRGAQADNDYSHELIYVHNLNELPIVINGGIPSTAVGAIDWSTKVNLLGEPNWMPFMPNDDGTAYTGYYEGLPYFIDYYESFLSGFVPYANEALVTFNDWQKSRVKTAHPLFVVQDSECENPECNDGHVPVYGTDGLSVMNWAKCPACMGNPKMTNPLGEWRVKAPDLKKLDNQAQPLSDLPRYLAPPVEGLQHMWDTCQNLITLAERELYQIFTEAAQSGDAKEIDREGKYTARLRISDHIFDHLIYNHLWFLIKLRNINNPKPPVIIKPMDFDLKDESEIAEELKELRDSGAPEPVIRQAEQNLMKRSFSNDDKAADVIRCMGIFDPLYGKSIEEIGEYVAIGAFDKVDVQRHVMCYQVVQNLIDAEGDEWVTDKNTEQVRAKMEAEFQRIAPKGQPAQTIVVPGLNG